MAVRRLGRQELEAELNRSALWAVTYGSLMSYLMILFLALFCFGLVRQAESGTLDEAVAQIQRAFGAAIGPGRLERIEDRKKQEQAPEKLWNLVAERQLAGQVEVVNTGQRITLVFSAAALFDLGKGDLKPEAEPVLAALAGPLRELRNDIVVEGYTDPSPVAGGHYRTNWELSMARAHAVIEFLANLGIEPNRLSGAGFGPAHPAASNATAEGQAKNRRIEISLVKR
ncbi:MAG: flagellar motor protein MotB [Elusimicrobia bacterium]|nr:flagellar motor protein MotB [Elusimicrobiota bacterium]